MQGCMQNVCKRGGRGVNLGYLKKRGGGGRSCKQSTGRQCYKISLVTLRGRDLHKGGQMPPHAPPPKYTPVDG